MDGISNITPQLWGANDASWAHRLQAVFAAARSMLIIGASVFATTLFVLGGVR